MPQKPLAIYLQDHLAGSTAGVNLARRFVKSHAGTQAGRTLAEVGGEIEADREVLLRLMAELGIEGSRVKNTAAWLTERLARLKPNGRLSGESAYQGLHELESLVARNHRQAGTLGGAQPRARGDRRLHRSRCPRGRRTQPARARREGTPRLRARRARGRRAGASGDARLRAAQSRRADLQTAQPVESHPVAAAVLHDREQHLVAAGAASDSAGRLGIDTGLRERA